jgi:DUF1680 family protein
LAIYFHVERVVGTDVEMIQQTNYPWDGKVAIALNPKDEKIRNW